MGLSGSSAIIVATFRSLLRYYNLSIDDLNIKKERFPEVILNIEKEELGISAGLQDRIIQTYGGLVHMDFTRSEVWQYSNIIQFKVKLFLLCRLRPVISIVNYILSFFLPSTSSITLQPVVILGKFTLL